MKGENEIKLTDLIMRLEKYRYVLLVNFSWPIFGMAFGGVVCIISAALLLSELLKVSVGPYIWGVLAIPGIVGGLLYGRLIMYLPRNIQVGKMQKILLILSIMFPFILAYLYPSSQFYYCVIWYPALGVGLLLNSFVLAKISKEYLSMESLRIASLLILVSSPLILYLKRVSGNFYGILASGLLLNGLMILIYLIAALISIFKAEKVIIEG